MKNINKDIEKALIKKALGYTQEETIEEYSKVDNDVILNKKKVTKKDVPPDMNAIKFLMEISDVKPKDIKEMSTEELLKEKEKYKKLLESVEEEI